MCVCVCVRVRVRAYVRVRASVYACVRVCPRARARVSESVRCFQSRNSVCVTKLMTCPSLPFACRCTNTKLLLMQQHSKFKSVSWLAPRYRSLIPRCCACCTCQSYSIINTTAFIVTLACIKTSLSSLFTISLPVCRQKATG